MKQINIVIAATCKNDLSILHFTEKIHETFDTHGKTLHNERNVIKSYHLQTADRQQELIVKRYKRPNLIQRIIYSFFRKSKAERSFLNARELRNRGIETPQEIAFIEQKKHLLLEHCYYISESNYAPPIEKELTLPAEFNKTLAECFADYAAQLHAKGILHHDLNSTNVRYRKTANNHYTFTVIDINRMKIFAEKKYPPLKACLRNLTKFTERMDLFEHVIRCYCNTRNLDPSLLQKAIRLKKTHDRKRKRRKAFLKKFKPKNLRKTSPSPARQP
jgi:tRNA A-37 threonylcarbamoyl transferase component Bud32